MPLSCHGKIKAIHIIPISTTFTIVNTSGDSGQFSTSVTHRRHYTYMIMVASSTILKTGVGCVSHSL